MEIEIWKFIPGYEDMYMVSNFGNVKSVDRKVKHNFGGYAIKKGLLLKKIKDKDGYLFVNLKKNQKGVKYRIHRLVCVCFIENTENKPQVNHINGIKNDNNLKNLEWCTLSENRQHAYDTNLQNGLSRRGINNNFVKLSKEDVLFIKNNYNKKTLNQGCLSKKFNVSQSCISSIINNKRWNYDLS